MTEDADKQEQPEKEQKPEQHSEPASMTEAILDSISEGVFTIDLDWRLTSINRAASEITGIPKEEAVGRPCWEVFRADVCETDCVLRQTLETGQPIATRHVHIVRTDGTRVPISVSTSLLRDSDGEVVGAVETFRDLSVIEALRKEISQQFTFADIISKNKRMREIFAILPEIARSEASVLIQGESGTGKELVARAIHNLSERKDGPLVTINCGALPDTLLESELFGYVEGAFTGARGNKEGKFAVANGGTLFLDEIGEVSAAMQVRLLRVLQERLYEPLGSNEPRETDVRIVAATNKDLRAEVKAGNFREDLFFRVNVIALTLPPLRERKEDIPPLVAHFINRFNRLRGKQIGAVSNAAMALLLRHEWPGNVREIENAIEHAFVLCQGDLILPAHLPEHLQPTGSEGRPAAEFADSLADVEAQLILRTLQRCDWNRTEAAEALGIHKTTLWRKMKKLGIKPSEHGAK